MPSLSGFVSAAVPTESSISIAGNPAIGLDGGSLTATIAELQAEINARASAAQGALADTAVQPAAMTAALALKADIGPVDGVNRLFDEIPPGTAGLVSDYNSDATNQIWQYQIRNSTNRAVMWRLEVQNYTQPEITGLTPNDYRMRVTDNGNGTWTIVFVGVLYAFESIKLEGAIPTVPGVTRVLRGQTTFT